MHPYPQPSRSISRRGIAPIEFAMSLPILLLLIVGIVWLGYIVVGQSQVIVQARTNAWAHRFENRSNAPLEFPTAIGSAANPLYDAEKDHATERATKEVHVSKVYDHFATPKSSHTVLAGSWDHRALPFNGFPEFELMAETMARGGMGNAQQVLNEIFNVSSQLENSFNTAKSTIENQAKSLASSLIPGGGAGLPSGPELGSNLDGGQQAGKQNQANDKAAAQQKLKDLGGRVDGGEVVSTDPNGQYGTVLAEIQRLEGAGKDLPKDAEGKDQPPKTPEQEQKEKAEQDTNNAQLEFLKIRKERLETAIRSADDDLRATG
jgi:hypothetical protein